MTSHSYSVRTHFDSSVSLQFILLISNNRFIWSRNRWLPTNRLSTICQMYSLSFRFWKCAFLSWTVWNAHNACFNFLFSYSFPICNITIQCDSLAWHLYSLANCLQFSWSQYNKFPRERDELVEKSGENRSGEPNIVQVNVACTHDGALYS